ncbi:MAG: DUF1285 domain-containing protein [Alphaproteobacteria bacterium]|nr:DUF1285 domain-containing protein [Alphaproteobacteria bacterium]
MDNASSSGLARLAAEAAKPPRSGAPPRDCGDFYIRIARDGSWFYRGSSIHRVALVRLFSRVLERDADGQYWLTTPAERGRIAVEDAPFVAVSLAVDQPGARQRLIFRTNVDDIVTLDAAHPLRVAEDRVTHTPVPYILVRDRLEARIARPVFYELVDLGRKERVGGETLFGVWSDAKFFPLGTLAEAH